MIDGEDSDEITVCPECDRAQIYALVGTDLAGNNKDADWKCKHGECSAEFDEPKRREPYRRSTATSPGAKALLDADPDDVGGNA